ncbi:hypothetical protein CAEBREN_13078 [Caenorhabditis brenneri]|uniref:BTB domain-containing protein n=1 Tax=Caenorhabditis brenneri TaxID=135651 RepID=G0NRB8_CAEBE|nr:hypothetical protein CAEBREN_13078 [Caenorhabditis brenneri]
MSFSSSLHANAAPQHFEMIAKVLQAKRNIGDSSTCDVKILLNNGYDMVHSIVVCAHSTVLLEALEPQRAPYQPFNMKDFDSDSVRRVMDWMYSGEIDIPENNIADVLAVVSYLRVSMLQRQIEMKLRNHSGSPILALNIASARASSVMDDTMNRLIHDLTEKLAGLSVEEVSKLTVNSMIAVMAAVVPMQKKVPLINMFVLWIQSKKPEKETINTILQSLAISDITYDALYAIRYALKQYLTNLEIASKSQLSVSPSGTIGIKITTKKTAKPGDKSASRATSPAAPFHRTQSELTAIEKLPDPFARRSFHTVSEIEDIRVLPDPFEKSVNSSQSNNSILRRETNNGFPKYFTRSEVENLQQMTDPFSKSEKETLPRLSMPVQSQPLKLNPFTTVNCTAKYPGWTPEAIEMNKTTNEHHRKPNYTPSEAQVIRQIRDPFARSPATAQPKYTPSEAQMIQQIPDPFVRSPAAPPKYTASEAQVISQIPDPFVRSPAAPPKFTRSEVQMIQQIPDPFGSRTSGPVIMRPAVGEKVSSTRTAIPIENSRKEFGRSSANHSFSGHSLNDGNNNNDNNFKNRQNRPNVIISVMSSVSPNCVSSKSVVRPPMVGLKKTDSEIQEINALPSFHSASYHTAKTSNSNKGKEEKSQKSQKSQSTPKKLRKYSNSISNGF